MLTSPARLACALLGALAVITFLANAYLCTILILLILCSWKDAALEGARIGQDVRDYAGARKVERQLSLIRKT